jgi:ankyrin repeat protein
VLFRLASAGADLTAAARSDGSTALHMAVVCNRLDVIEALLEAGAPLEATARSDTTALHCAAMQGQTQTLRYLLDKGASLNAKTVDGGEML